MDFIKRMLLAAVGLMMFGVGVYLVIQANIGVAPWDALTLGLAKSFNLLYGTVSITISFIIIVIDIILKERIGWGTILDAIVVGKTVDFLNWIDIVPEQNNILISIPMILVGFFIMGYSQYVYMKAGLCCGPRDALLIALGKRMNKLPIGAVNGILLLVVLFFGWRLGGPIGIGTVIAPFGIGFMQQIAFNMRHFEPKDVVHEDFIQSFKRLKK